MLQVSSPQLTFIYHHEFGASFADLSPTIARYPRGSRRLQHHHTGTPPTTSSKNTRQVADWKFRTESRRLFAVRDRRAPLLWVRGRREVSGGRVRGHREVSYRSAPGRQQAACPPVPGRQHSTASARLWRNSCEACWLNGTELYPICFIFGVGLRRCDIAQMFQRFYCVCQNILIY